MSAITDRTPLGASRDTSRALLGPVMGFVASTVAFAGLGAYLGRDLSPGGTIIFFLAAFACILGLNAAAARGREPLAIVLLFTLGLLLGIAVAPTLAAYGNADPAALWQAAAATAAFVAALSSYGYAIRRDLSGLARTLFWALLALIVFGLVAIFVSIPGGNAIYALAGLAIFGGFTVVDFNRLRRAGQNAAVPIAASIFNVFVLLLGLLDGRRG